MLLRQRTISSGLMSGSWSLKSTSPQTNSVARTLALLRHSLKNGGGVVERVARPIIIREKPFQVRATADILMMRSALAPLVGQAGNKDRAPVGREDFKRARHYSAACPPRRKEAALSRAAQFGASERNFVVHV